VSGGDISTEIGDRFPADLPRVGIENGTIGYMVLPWCVARC